MSGPMAVPTAGAAAAAAAKRRMEQQEEEHMTGYNADDLNGWEFKIIRSIFNRFRDPAHVRQVLEEEARAGWEFLEKFDDTRIRLKRRVEKREADATLGYDPYRTSYGPTEATIALTVIGVISLIILTVLLLVNAGH